MSVIIPKAVIQARWNGALQARLRRAPLEVFLRARGLKWATSGESHVTDNLACATIHILNAALASAGAAYTPLAVSNQAAVGSVACEVSSSLARLIQEPARWRTAALVGTARVLEWHTGLSAAAHAAAAAVRLYQAAVGQRMQEADLLQVGGAVQAAVLSNGAAEGTHAVRQIVAWLAAAATPEPANEPSSACAADAQARASRS